MLGESCPELLNAFRSGLIDEVSIVIKFLCSQAQIELRMLEGNKVYEYQHLTQLLYRGHPARGKGRAAQHPDGLAIPGSFASLGYRSGTPV